MHIMESIAVTERDCFVANDEMSKIRMECSNVDNANMNVRKEIDYNEKLLSE